MSIQVFQEVVDGSVGATPVELKRPLPTLLWLAYLARTHFWVYDNSQGQSRRRALARGAAKLLGTVLPLTRLPFARGLLNQALDLVRLAQPQEGSGTRIATKPAAHTDCSPNTSSGSVSEFSTGHRKRPRSDSEPNSPEPAPSQSNVEWLRSVRRASRCASTTRE